ncbi:MAG TPA: GatB/YqeY domain-containing protein [bacterium]|nr:GatB/YqeY domain-containing protein [bacterium]
MIDIEAHIKQAMKSKDAAALIAYRSLKAKTLLKLTEAGRPQGKALTEEEFMQVARKEIRERQEANEFFKPDHPTYQENARIIAVLEGHLPQAPSAEQTDVLIRQVMAEVNPQGPKDMGKVMAGLKKANPQVDMAAASARVKALLEAKP